jgi:hypothetical protein
MPPHSGPDDDSVGAPGYRVSARQRWSLLTNLATNADGSPGSGAESRTHCGASLARRKQSEHVADVDDAQDAKGNIDLVVDVAKVRGTHQANSSFLNSLS